MAAIADFMPFKTAAKGHDLARRLGLTGFGRWWMHELGELMPARLRDALERRRTRPVLAFDGSRATLWRPAQTNGRVQMVAAAEIPLYADAESVAAGGRAVFAPLMRTANGTAPEIVVALSPRASLRKTITLPAAIEGNLHQALAYDLDRHTPFKADELYFDAVVVDRDGARNTLQVELAAARRAVVDPMLRHAENFGARVVAITVDPPATTAASRLNLLPIDRRDSGSAWLKWPVVVPAVLLAAGIVTALVLPIWQKRTEAIALNEQSDQARQRAAVSDALRTELERKVGDYNFALERKYAFPATFQVLDDITRILPDDTWLTQLELRAVRGKDGQRELALRGESANAGRLVSLLEDSRLFTQTAPRSPTTKIQPGPGEIFDVGAQLKPLPAPPAAPLDVTAPPPPVAATMPRVPAPASVTGAAAPTASTPVASTPPVSGTRPGTSPPAPIAPGATAAAPTATGASAPAASGAAPPAVAAPIPSATPQPPAPRGAPGARLVPTPGAVARPASPLAPAVNPATTGAPPGALPAPSPPLEPSAPDTEPQDGDGNPP
jgi:general secretion pathway protein L